jgi:hypothetical protein
VSKKYRDKTCVYCADAPSVTADHIIARQFFLSNRRSDLPKVPACEACNRQKSELEHYLTAVLPFGGRHPDATEALGTMVPIRLLKNRRLNENLIAGLRRSTARHPDADSLAQTSLAIPIDSVLLRQLFALITKGLVWYHWQTILGPGCSVRAEAISQLWAQRYGQFFGMKARDHVKANLGEGTFCYEGLQAEEPRELTIWRFSIYGGACLSGDPKAPATTSSQVLAITGPELQLHEIEPTLFGCRSDS